MNRPWLGVAAGLAAVFFRELALPYAVLRRPSPGTAGERREAAAWLVGLAAWAAFFAPALLAASAAGRRPTPLAHRQGWVQLGGASFVLATVQANACLLLAAHVGHRGSTSSRRCSAWPAGTRRWAGGRRLSLCLFVAAFSVVGQDFNRYWGMMIAPLLCFGAVRAPASLWDLCRAAAVLSPLSHWERGRG